MSAAPKLLVVGNGHGVRVHLPAARAVGFEVVGIVGANPERTQKRASANNVAAFTDLDEAIAKTGAIAVTIATPPRTHAPLTLTALARGCHVLCEKPFATDAKEAVEVLATARRAGTFCIMGNQFRLRPERRLIATAIKDGLIGTPRFATFIQYASLLASPEARMPRWWFDIEAGGGWLGASGSHVIDQIRSWLGEFESVSATLPSVADRPGKAEDSFSIRFTMQNGCEGVFQQTGAAWGPYAAMTRVAGPSGALWIDDGKAHHADAAGERELPAPADMTLPPFESSNAISEFIAIELPPAKKLMELWRSAILTGELDPSVGTFEDGAASMSVIDAVRASAAQNGATVSIA